MTDERMEFLKRMVNLDYQDRHDIPQLHFTVDDLRHLLEEADKVKKLLSTGEKKEMEE